MFSSAIDLKDRLDILHMCSITSHLWTYYDSTSFRSSGKHFLNAFCYFSLSVIATIFEPWQLISFMNIEQESVPIIATVIKTYENGKRWWPTTSIELPAVVKNDEPKYSITKYDPVDGTNVKLVSWGYDWSYQNKRWAFYRWQFCRIGKLSLL